MDLYDFVGGYGHMVMIGRSRLMTHAETDVTSARVGTRLIASFGEKTHSLTPPPALPR